MTILGNVLLLVGASLMALSALGILRLPDVFTRMHAGTKAASLGLACSLLGGAFLLDGALSRTKLILAIVFQFMTAPVAAHLIGRAAYRSGVRMWEGTGIDELGRDLDEDTASM